MCKVTKHVFVSPHLDDVALSCGGLMAQLALSGHEVIALTLFAATPADDELTPIARELKARWQAGEDPVATRRAEDEAACAVLGAKPAHLSWADCPYRAGSDGEGLYPSEESLFSDIHQAESAFPAEIASAIRKFMSDGCRVYGPLGAGHHVDHLLARDACQLLAADGAEVWHYEDYPYADDDVVVQLALADCGAADCQPTTISLSEADLNAKLDAVAQHRSQIDTFWRDDAGQPDLAQMRQAIAAYCRRIGNGQTAERYWIPTRQETA